MEDTIVAISTSLGVGAISIIRLSGNDSIQIVNKIFDKDLTKTKSHTITYGHIVYQNEIIDEVLVTIMLSPKTFTRENIVEINCHGGINTTNKVLELTLESGARLATPGEFTKRAFLNGRIDLTEAEAVMNLINAQSDIARKLSINQLTGKTKDVIHNIREQMVSIIGNIDVNIDYPEYKDIETITNEDIIPKLTNIKSALEDIINKSNLGQLIQTGIKIGIVGKPNVGKSSLLNALIEQEKAIVTEIAGTTRDIVEGSIIINGLQCNFIDTAGIHQTSDIVEKLGVDKSYDVIQKSDLVILVLNNNEELSIEEKQIIQDIEKKPHLIVVNKIDLPSKLKLNNLEYIPLSIKNDQGIDELKKKISDLYSLDKISTDDLTYISSARSLSLLKQATEKINLCFENIKNQLPIDIIEIDLKESWNILGEITGETYNEELIDSIFSKFCLGK